MQTETKDWKDSGEVHTIAGMVEFDVAMVAIVDTEEVDTIKVDQWVGR
jgi:hypothetical protein